MLVAVSEKLLFRVLPHLQHGLVVAIIQGSRSRSAATTADAAGRGGGQLPRRSRGEKLEQIGGNRGRIGLDRGRRISLFVVRRRRRRRRRSGRVGVAEVVQPPGEGPLGTVGDHALVGVGKGGRVEPEILLVELFLCVFVCLCVI